MLRSAGLLCTDGSDDLASGVILFFNSRRFWCVLRFPQNWKQQQESSSSSNSVTIDAPSHKPTAPPRSEYNWISCKHTTRHVDQSHPAVAVNPDDVTHRVSLHFVDPLNVEVSVVDSQVDEVFPASTDNRCTGVMMFVYMYMYMYELVISYCSRSSLSSTSVSCSWRHSDADTV